MIFVWGVRLSLAIARQMYCGTRLSLAIARRTIFPCHAAPRLRLVLRLMGRRSQARQRQGLLGALQGPRQRPCALRRAPRFSI